MKERVIVPYVRKHTVAMADATMAYVGATSSNVKFMLEENEHIPKNFQVARQKSEKSTGSTMAEMRKVILTKVSTLEATMQKIYNRFVTVHKAVFHLFGF